MTGGELVQPGWQSLRVNALSTIGARLLVPGLNLLLIVALARLGGASSLGQYTLLITIFVLFENLKSLGLTTLTVREIASQGTAALGYYSGLVRIGLVGAAIAALPMCIAPVWLRHTSTEFRVAAIVLTAGLFPSAYALANDALFLGLGRASYSLAITFCENIFRLLGSLLVVFFWHGGLVYLAVIYALSRCLAACGQQLVIRQLLHLTVPKADRLIVREMLRGAPSFSTVFVAPLVLLRLDIVILGIIGGPAQVGLYSAAMRLLSVCLILPDGIMTATFALLSKLSALENPACFRRLVDRTLKWMGAGLLPVSAGMALLAPFGLPLLYGPKFAVAIPVLKTLSWSLVPFAVNRAIGDALVARGLQKIVARIVVISCGVSVFLYVLLIHISPLQGAAWAFNLSILCFCLLSVREALGRVGIVAPRAVWRALLPAVAGSAVFALTNSVLWRAIWFMAAVFVVAIPVVRAFRPGLTSRSSEMTRIPAGVQ